MSVDPKAIGALTPAVVVEPKRRRWPWLFAAPLVLVAGGWAWSSGLFSGDDGPRLALLDVDRGPLELFLVETGTLESAKNTSIKCQVEALLGTTGGASGTGRTSGTTGGASGGSSSGSSSSAGSARATTTAKSGTAAKSAGTAKASTATSTATSSASSSSSSSTESSAETPLVQRPTITSFNYMVAKYVPLKSATTTKAATKSNTSASAAAAMASGGGRGGRGGSGGSSDEKPGSTRIIWVKPEGSMVKAGEVICELDSAAFRDELQAQRIRWAQAKAVVDQAESIHQVNDITYREFRDGVLPQDVELIRAYIVQCETQAERARKTEAWSRDVLAKRYRAAAQYQADKLALDQAELALREARGMEERLVKFTGPRILKELEAKLKAIESDKLAQTASFAIEDDRLRRLEKMVANCTIKAPADGILVYSNQSNGWGRVEVQIQEGVTVREGQTLFDLPDPKRMRVKVKVNESKMDEIRPGQRAIVRVEAFPGREMEGVVTEITPIPAPQNRFSDVKIYFANVDINADGFEGLRAGMTAEVAFLVGASADVTRIPLQAVRWASGRAFVAVASRQRWQWRPVTLGLLGPGHAEVVQGLAPGDRVVASPDALPAPDPALLAPETARTAAAPANTPHGG